METNFSCSEDSFDAIYKCSCFKMLCPKHYFSHQENSPDHQINRIKMNVNKESRKILTNLVITCKQKLIAKLNEVYLESYSKENFEKYQDWLAKSNDIIYKLNWLLLFLAKTKYIFKKSFYTAFEYFLHQPTEKAWNYARDFNFPQNFKRIFDFNYFKFEDKRYIFGFSYTTNYDKMELSTICAKTIEYWFSCSEYEMAYETLKNLINIVEIADPGYASFWTQLAKIVYNFIKKRNTIKLIKEWKKIEANLPKDYDFIFYEISKCLSEGLNEQDFLLHLLENQEIITQDDDYSSWELFELGFWFYKCKNYKKAKKYFIKCIRKFQNSSNISDLNHVIKSCTMLALFYLHLLRKNQRKVEKNVNFVNKIIQPFRKICALDAALLAFYSIMSDWDNAHKVAWKLIKLHEKNQTNYLNSSKLVIYLWLAFIYRGIGDDKKFLQALANAKSCCGILSMKDIFLNAISFQFGWFYLKNEQYKEAAYYIEQSINTQKDKIKMTWSKLYAGIAHYNMENYDRALEYFIEIEDDLLKIIDIYSYKTFGFYLLLGKSYNCTNNKEKASRYYFKAYEILNDLEYEDGFNEFDLFSYFFDNEDYEKCKAILQIWSIWVEKSTYFAFKITIFYYSYRLYKKQNKIEEANIYLEKAEKLINLDKISLIHKKKVYWDIARVLLLMASAYTYIEHDFFKAEKILIFFERALDSSIPSHAFYLNLLYETLLYIYIEQNRQVEINIYSQKYVNLLKLADQNEVWRENIRISEADIKEMIRKYQ